MTNSVTPTGWKLVPCDPTPEMVGAWYRYKSGFRFPDEPPAADTSDYGAYRAMLAAAPLPPQSNVPCPCTLIEQDEDCPVGYPSMICGICKGTGNTTPDQVTALACEMIKIASDIGEPEDPFATWESIDLIKSQHAQMRKALTTIGETQPSGHLDFQSPKHSGYAALEIARAALASAGQAE